MLDDDPVAEANAAAITERGGAMLSTLDWRVRRVLEARSLSGTQKYIKLTLIADEVGETAKPNSPCRRGCSYCCNQAVPISEHEADNIAAFTGRPRRELGAGPTNRETLDRMRSNQQRYSAKPCTFLRDGECTIYEVRPMNCRTHISVAATPEPCDIFTRPGGRVPLLDLRALQEGVVELFMSRQYGDVRDFFPPEG